MKGCLPALLVSLVISAIITFFIFLIVQTVGGSVEQWLQQRKETEEKERLVEIKEKARQDSVMNAMRETARLDSLREEKIRMMLKKNNSIRESNDRKLDSLKRMDPDSRPTAQMKEAVGESPMAVNLNMSVLWADRNLGSTKRDLTGTYYGRDGKVYVNKESIDRKLANKYIGGTEFDPATRLLGKGWRMPTTKEFDELKKKCKWTWTDAYAIPGFIVSYGKSRIFLPAAGSFYENRKVDDRIAGYYWTGDVQNQNYFYFQYNLITLGSYNADYGFPIRPVKEK